MHATIPVKVDFVEESHVRWGLGDAGHLYIILLSIELIDDMQDVIAKSHADVVSGCLREHLTNACMRLKLKTWCSLKRFEWSEVDAQ